VEIEKAIETLEHQKQSFEILLSERPTTCIKERVELIIESHRLAIQALEKQAPKKVKIKAWSPSVCPTCGILLSESAKDGYYKHPTFLQRCPNIECAQRLDWGDEQ